MTQPLVHVLDDLADLVGRIGPDLAAAPTPCTDFDLGALRQHVLGWLTVFAAALTDPDGAEPRPDAASYQAPDDPEQAAAQVRRSAAQISAALAGGVADRPVRLLGADPLPGAMVVGMLTGEVIAHGWDLARSAGLPWNPPAETCDAALAALNGMLQPQYRGEGKPFSVEVAAADDASPLSRLVAFSGRDPEWVAQGRNPHT
jgi:uncharacterized protein (TIGR03086 family)